MPANTKISEIMTKNVFTVTLEDTVGRVDEIMREEGVRHVPVLEESKFIGLITERSLMEFKLRELYEFDENIDSPDSDNLISDFEHLMSTNVHIIYPEDSIKKAIELMVKKKADCLPVVDWENNLLGIVTSMDILLFFNRELT